MELRILQYFLTVAREQSITRASEYLHITQPTLSRQLRELENELGKQLFVRGNRKIILTDEGLILRKRAEEIIDLAHKTEREVSLADTVIEGDVSVGAGETESVRLIAKAAKLLQSQHPQIRFHITSGDTQYIMEQIDKGLLDFGLIFSQVDPERYGYMHIRQSDMWGLLVRKDSPLVKKGYVEPDDLRDVPLIVSRQLGTYLHFDSWLSYSLSELKIVATYSLIYNASIMVDEGVGCVLTLDRLINVSGDSNLTFLPLSPRFAAHTNLIWKKYQVFTKASEKFFCVLQEFIENGDYLQSESDDIM